MKRAFAAILITALVSLPVPAQTRVDEIVARVNDDIILKSDINRELEYRRIELRDQGAQGAVLDQAIAEQSRTILRDLIDRALLMQVASEIGLNADLEVLKAMEQLREERKFATIEELERAIVQEVGDLEEFKQNIRVNYLTRRVIEGEVYGRIVITTDEMEKYYAANQKEFDRPAGLRLGHILVLVDRRLPDQVAVQRKKMEEAMAALKKGEAFEEVAARYSEDPDTAPKGGDLGFFPDGSLNEQTMKLVGSLPKGQMTDIIEASDAFVIYKVTDRHSGGILTFDLAQEFIWNALMSEVAPTKIRDFLNRLRQDGFVEVKEGYTDAGAVKKPA